MATTYVKLKFGFNINASVQENDIVYYVPVSHSNAMNTATGYSNIVKMGPVASVERQAITVQHDDNMPLPTVADFLMFSKDNSANLSSLLGYYADVKFVNESVDKAEIFSIGMDVFESSK